MDEHKGDKATDESKATDATDWSGPDDEGNPHNWSSWKKYYHTSIPTVIAFICPFGSSVYTPGRNGVIADFGVSNEVALLPFCLYLLGLSLGPILAAPVSETFGRRWVYMSSLPITGLFTLGSGFAQNIQTLTLLRFFAGMFSSVGLSIGTGTIADVWGQEKKGYPMSMFVAFAQLGPALGPLIGGFVAEKESWRWTQWVLDFTVAAVIMQTLGMSETYKPVILKNRAKKLGIKGPDTGDESLAETLKYFLRKTILRPIHMLFTEVIVLLFDLYIAITFGLLNAFFAAFPLVFTQTYGFNLGSVGLTFLGQAVGTFIGFIGLLLFDSYYYQPRAQQLKQEKGAAKLPPEQRLWIAMAGAPMLPISLFWFGWTARSDIHWISPVAAEALFGCGNLLLFTCSSLYLTDAYGAQYGASAWSSNTFLRYLFATAFPLFAEQMYENLHFDWASSLLAFITLALVPIPFVFYRYGAHLRRNSKFAPTH